MPPINPQHSEFIDDSAYIINGYLAVVNPAQAGQANFICFNRTVNLSQNLFFSITQILELSNIGLRYRYMRVVDSFLA